MRLVIVGAGRVGFRTARILREEGHDVTLVENDPETAQRVRADGFEVVEGDGATESVLERTDPGSADAVGGLTGDLNVNFAACMLGKHHGARTVLRIDADYREDIYRKFAGDVDEVVYPERLGAAGAKTALLGGDFNVVADLTERLALATVVVSDESPVVGQQVRGVDLPRHARVYAHGHGRERMTIPLPNATVEAGDRLAVITEREALAEVRQRLQGDAAASAS
ncbi:potassium channel family protein [Halorussus halobius]|uniref:potassium channel family protein n=1 Tax=Halorussus halobius TaxID=1710537 RepID=UPI001092D041|nr:TrkA family potassium uptake protein [Halorussus halobius]